MIDPQTVGVTLSSLKTAADIAKSLMSLRDASQIKCKVTELQDTIIAAQSEALSAQSEQLTLLQRVRDLQAEVAKLQSELAALRSRPAIPEARICPLCRGEMRVTAEHADADFGFAGLKVHEMQCIKCHNKTTRQFEPGKGYS